MLDYYDRCYDHELERHGQTEEPSPRERLDCAGLTAQEAAEQLIERGAATRSAMQHH